MFSSGGTPRLPWEGGPSSCIPLLLPLRDRGAGCLGCDSFCDALVAAVPPTLQPGERLVVSGLKAAKLAVFQVLRGGQQGSRGRPPREIDRSHSNQLRGLGVGKVGVRQRSGPG